MEKKKTIKGANQLTVASLTAHGTIKGDNQLTVASELAKPTKIELKSYKYINKNDKTTGTID